MDRKEFFTRAKRHGHREGKKMDVMGRNRFKQELIDYYNTPAGQEAIEKAPQWLREKPVEEIVELLLQEVD